MGRIAEVRDPKPYSGNDSNNLVRWGDDAVLMGFHPEDLELAPMTEEEVERAHDRAASEPPRRCSMGVGCDEAGVCYAAAHGKPEECPE